jgi:hypothetical protein
MVGDPEKTQTEKEDLVLLDEEVLIEETIEVLIGEMIVVVLTDAMITGEMIEEKIETAEDLATEGVVLEEEMTTIEGTQGEDLDQDLDLLLKDQALQSAQNHQ